MASKFLNMLKNRDWILTDGATGTNLFAMRLEAGDAPELWNETQPGKVEEMLGVFSSTGDGTCLSSQLQKRVRRRRRAT